MLFADVAVLVEKSREKLRILVKQFDSDCVSKRMRVNTIKSKVMRIRVKDETVRGEVWKC